MLNRLLQTSLFLLLAALLMNGSGCKPDEPPVTPVDAKFEDLLTEGSEVNLSLNPAGIAPLSAVAILTTREECQVDVKVMGDIPVEGSFDTWSTFHSIPVLGLYASRNNQIELTLDVLIPVADEDVRKLDDPAGLRIGVGDSASLLGKIDARATGNAARVGKKRAENRTGANAEIQNVGIGR